MFDRLIELRVRVDQRSSRRTALGLDIMSIIIFSGESSQLENVFRSICRHDEHRVAVTNKLGMNDMFVINPKLYLAPLCRKEFFSFLMGVLLRFSAFWT